MKSRLAAALLVIFLSSCGFVSFEDVSSDPAFSGYVHGFYQTTSEMKVYRISMDRNYGPTPSLYQVIPPPGIDGPEVLSVATIPAGTTLQVQAVERCVDCYLDKEPRVEMVVLITSDTRFNDLDVRVAQEFLLRHMSKIPAPGERS
jgi:hypothetical protein